jgi:hypothetical protein
VVLLIDEIDRADDELRGLPARGPLGLPDHHPGDRDHRRAAAARGDPHLQPHARAARRAQRRCLMPLDHPPRLDREVEIVRLASPGCRQAGRRGRGVRRGAPPPRPGQGARVAETIDWAHALAAAGAASGSTTAVRRADAGSVLKYHEDFDLVATTRWPSCCARRARRRTPWRRERRAPAQPRVLRASVLREAGSRSARAGWPTGRGPRPRRARAPDDVYWTLRTTLVTPPRGARPLQTARGRLVPRRPWRRRGAGRGPRSSSAAPSGAAARPCAAGPPPDGPPEAIGISGHEIWPQGLAPWRRSNGSRSRAIARSARAGARTAARAPARQPRYDLRALARAAIDSGGDPVHRSAPTSARAARGLCVVSGSMRLHARPALPPRDRALGARVEVFASAPPDAADARAALRDPTKALPGRRAVVDWAGGSR